MGTPFKVESIKARRSSMGRQDPYKNLLIQGIRSQAGQQRNPDEVTVGRTDPYTGERTETPANAIMGGRSKLVEQAQKDAFNLSNAYTLIDDFEKQYRQIFPDAEKKAGLTGRYEASQKWLDAVTVQSDPKAVSFLDGFDSQGAKFAKFFGDAANISVSERKDTLQAFGRLNPKSITKGLLPDAPAVGIQKYSDIKKRVAKGIVDAQLVINSGGEQIPDTYMESFPEMSQSSSVPGMNQQEDPKTKFLRRKGLI